MITKQQSEVLWELVCKYETAIQESTRNEGCKFFEGRQDYACELLFNYVTSITATDAVATQGDGWIEWDSGPFRPANDKAYVKVRFKTGNEDEGFVDQFYWTHPGLGRDIIAYCIVRK